MEITLILLGCNLQLGNRRCGAALRPGPWFNLTMSSYQYRKTHCGDKTILRPSYLHNRISYTGKMTSLYWIGPSISSMPVDGGVLCSDISARIQWRYHCIIRRAWNAARIQWRYHCIIRRAWNARYGSVYGVIFYKLCNFFAYTATDITNVIYSNC